MKRKHNALWEGISYMGLVNISKGSGYQRPHKISFCPWQDRHGHRCTSGCWLTIPRLLTLVLGPICSLASMGPGHAMIFVRFAGWSCRSFSEGFWSWYVFQLLMEEWGAQVLARAAQFHGLLNVRKDHSQDDKAPYQIPHTLIEVPTSANRYQLETGFVQGPGVFWPCPWQAAMHPVTWQLWSTRCC